MTHDVIRHLLDDYVTGELTEDARAPVAEHIAGCEVCSAEVESLKRILARAADLPRSVEPPAEAWSSIKRTIERDAQALTPRRSFAGYNWTPWAMAAAALLVAAISSGGTFLYLARDGGETTAHSSVTAPGETPANLVAFTLEENNYLRTASMLQDLLERQQGALAPETIAQLRASLRTIDEAILEARNALARDPANKLLVEMVSASYRQKVDLLRRTTEMTRGS
jgi:anti-sigma-K factor RskA